MATTQEFQASTPQEQNNIICWLGVTEQPLFAPFINIDHAVNDLMDTGEVHLILGTQDGAFKRWEAFKTWGFYSRL